mmetsp:Transcript_45136/g.128909  ORF Transcript_45136/g.128909 Transcript_45136/m.128909 type:complete len:245 (-) Transcript_45136:825-1559(-)
MSSTSSPSKESPSTNRRSSTEIWPVSSRSKREKVLRSTSSWTLTFPRRAPARNSVYSTSASLSVSRLSKRMRASALSTWKLSCSTAFSSLIVIVPLLSVSIRRNCSRSSTRSSVDMDQAIIERTARRKWDARAKLRRLARMPTSMWTPLARRWFRIQGLCRAAEALSLWVGSATRSDRTNVCAGSENFWKRVQYWGLPSLIFAIICSSPPWNGGLPVSSMYTMTPSDHMSACTVYECARTSGAT